MADASACSGVKWAEVEAEQGGECERVVVGDRRGLLVADGADRVACKHGGSALPPGGGVVEALAVCSSSRGAA